MNKKHVPIFMAADERYLPYLAVALKSIQKHASEGYVYDVRILSTDITRESLHRIQNMELPDLNIHTVNLEKRISGIREALGSRLRDYYSESIYYRIFIPEMFPELKRAVYIDCDVILCEDIALLYETELCDNLLAAASDQSVPPVPEFCDYVESWVGVDSDLYFNSGVLVMNLEEMRKERITDRFLFLLNKYNFDTVAPDQDYLNYLCRGRIEYLSPLWNKQPRFEAKGEPRLIHYNMFDKPWHYHGVNHSELFWQIADCTPFAEELHTGLLEYTDEQRALDKEGAGRLVAAAGEIADHEGGFAKTMLVEIDGELCSIDL